KSTSLKRKQVPTTCDEPKQRNNYIISQHRYQTRLRQERYRGGTPTNHLSAPKRGDSLFRVETPESNVSHPIHIMKKPDNYAGNTSVEASVGNRSAALAARGKAISRKRTQFSMNALKRLSGREEQRYISLALRYSLNDVFYADMEKLLGQARSQSLPQILETIRLSETMPSPGSAGRELTHGVDHHQRFPSSLKHLPIEIIWGVWAPYLSNGSWIDVTAAFSTFPAHIPTQAYSHLVARNSFLKIDGALHKRVSKLFFEQRFGGSIRNLTEFARKVGAEKMGMIKWIQIIEDYYPDLHLPAVYNFLTDYGLLRPRGVLRTISISYRYNNSRITYSGLRRRYRELGLDKLKDLDLCIDVDGHGIIVLKGFLDDVC
ncbi:hypothetical protein LTR72_012263, partial [Exophiala xenobiotica]